LYNMSGNVNEWVADVYRPLSPVDQEDVSPFRGNRFQNVYKTRMAKLRKTAWDV